MSESQAQLEKVGPNYDREQMMAVRRKTLDAVQSIARAVQPGMLEEEAVEAARQILKGAGLLRGWHGIKVRFGENTLNVFSAPSKPGVVLQPNDIFFVDIGPVFQKWEGDAGDTFVVGGDADMHRAARDVRSIFDLVQAKWRSEGLTGKALYDYAVEQSEALGWKLNLDTNGHRLSEFPHEAHYAGALATTDFKPTADLWVLEIQIRHPTRPFGAFYEDLLLDQSAG